MTTIRQDAWTQDEDLLLAEVVLRHIREGSTQLAAFEEVGEKLSRTAAACGFRWNSAVRKQYKSAIEIAKKQRKGEKIEERLVNGSAIIENKCTHHPSTEKKVTSNASEKISFDVVIQFLTSIESTIRNTERLLEENELLKKEVNELKEQRNEWKEKYEELMENYHIMEEDYKALIDIMERARKMIVLQEEEGAKFKFQMDKNGNLERINK